MAEILLHAKQEQAIYSQKRITIMCAGIQGGKTTSGAIWMRRRISQVTDSNVNFLITAPTVKIFNQSTEPAFVKMFHGLGKYNRSEHVFEMNRGRRIFLRSLHEPDAIEGMTNVMGIWPDELGKCNLKAWTNIEGRSAFKMCPIFGTTTPYALNWLWKDIYKPWKQGKRQDVEFIQFPSIENPHFPKQEYERQQALLDPRVFAMKYKGQFERMAGLVYPDFDDVLNYEDPFSPHPRDYFICAGIDFGFTNPFAVTVRAMHRKQPRDYQVGEFYRSGMLLDDMTNVLRKMQIKLGVEIFYADSEDPRTIADLRARGINIHPATKGPGSVKNGIASHGELIRTREYKLFRAKCPHTEDEYATYHYPEDQGEDSNQDENPVKANDHCFAAGTMVETVSGPKPIEYVRSGDLVATRAGYQRVKEAGITCESATVNRYVLHPGIVIDSTPEHPIYTVNRGFIPINQLMQTDTILILESWLKRLDGTDTHTGDTQSQNAYPIAGISSEQRPKMARSTSIGMFGNFIAGRYQRACKSITSMKIPGTTVSKILLCWMQKPISTPINPHTGAARSSAKILPLRESLERYGIGVQRVANGIASTPNQSNSRLENTYVRFAEKNTPHSSHIVLCAVLTAPPSVFEIGAKPVYNLSVENRPEYFANGVLVHNCMNANMYVTTMTKEFRRNRDAALAPISHKTDLEEMLSGDWAKRTLGTKDPSEDWYNA